MRLNSRFWYLLSVLCFVVAVWFWLKGDEERARRKAGRGTAAAQRAGPLAGSKGQAPAGGAHPGGPTGKGGAIARGNQAPRGGGPGAKPSATGAQGRFPY